MKFFCSLTRGPHSNGYLGLIPVAACVLVGQLTACSPALSGHLRTAAGEPLVSSSDDARVNIVSLAPGETNAVVVKVDREGRFATNHDLTPGPYMVEALVPGYGVASQRIMLGEHDNIELVLSPLTKAKAQAIGANLDAAPNRGVGAANLTPPNL